MIKGNKKNIKSIRKPGKKKIFYKWFSLDNLMGKALCILLVLILMLGAFIAPKLINNLYDAGTLMQIAYMDMDLSTYAVAYTSFQEKIEALAQRSGEEEELVVLSAEESSEKIGDEELIEIVNKEIESLSEGLSVLFNEGWWSRLTEENLVSRVKNTAYMQPQGNAGENISGREMAPIQFWVLTFEITNEQKYSGYVGDDSQYVTDRLIVCLDADFYKIYAVAIEGNKELIVDYYGWNLDEMFGTAFSDNDRKRQYAEDSSEYLFEIKISITDLIMEHWSEYWGVWSGNDRVYIPGETAGFLVIGDEEEKAEENGEEMIMAAGEMVDGVVEAENGGKLYKDPYMDIYDAEYRVAVEEAYGEPNDGGDEDGLYGSGDDENRVFLEVGCQGYTSDVDYSMWIQKIGCREFFELMRF